MNELEGDLGSTWATTWTRRVGGHVADLRGARKMSAQDLSDRTRELGYEVTRSSIANLESGRKSTVSMAELAALAAGLGVAPLRLMFDVEAGDVEVLPGRKASQADGADWFAGIANLEGRANEGAATGEFGGPMPYFRQHRDALESFLRFALLAAEHPGEEAPSQFEAEAVRARADRVIHVRELMEAKGYAPPSIDPEARTALTRWSRLG